jgi:hypothetical protein
MDRELVAKTIESFRDRYIALKVEYKEIPDTSIVGPDLGSRLRNLAEADAVGGELYNDVGAFLWDLRENFGWSMKAQKLCSQIDQSDSYSSCTVDHIHAVLENHPMRLVGVTDETAVAYSNVAIYARCTSIEKGYLRHMVFFWGKMGEYFSDCTIDSLIVEVVGSDSCTEAQWEKPTSWAEFQSEKLRGCPAEDC